MGTPKKIAKSKQAAHAQVHALRQPMLLVVCGETGVGKTYRNKLEFINYLKGEGAESGEGSGVGLKGRKILAFDTNDDDYPEMPTINPDHLKKMKKVQARRIRPFNADGTPMSINDKKEVVSKILTDFKNGLVALDDIDDYMTGARGQSMIGALCTLRHKGVDIVLTHQSIAKISTSAWQNCTWLRLHHQVDDVTRYQSRIPKYPLVRIAQHIVDEQYNLACNLYAAGQLTEQAYTIRKSFFVYVNMRHQKLLGCSRAAFIRAAKKYIDQEAGRQVTRMLKETDWSGNKKYQHRNEVVVQLIGELLRYHGGSAKAASPFQMPLKE